MDGSTATMHESLQRPTTNVHKSHLSSAITINIDYRIYLGNMNNTVLERLPLIQSGVLVVQKRVSF